jgi:hypothetical protein|nr:MAG TPA: hypothetical protein [Caudoviricetes sp.]
MNWSNTSYRYTISVIKGIIGGFQHSLDRKCNTKRWALMELEELGTSNWGFSNLKTRLIDNAIQKAIRYVKVPTCQIVRYRLCIILDLGTILGILKV